jgi:hypothetical protein
VRSRVEGNGGGHAQCRLNRLRKVGGHRQTVVGACGGRCECAGDVRYRQVGAARGE